MYSEHIHPVKGDKIPQVVSPRAWTSGGGEALGLALPHAEMQVIGAEAPMGQGHLTGETAELLAKRWRLVVPHLEVSIKWRHTPS